MKKTLLLFSLCISYLPYLFSQRLRTPHGEYVVKQVTAVDPNVSGSVKITVATNKSIYSARMDKGNNRFSVYDLEYRIMDDRTIVDFSYKKGVGADGFSHLFILLNDGGVLDIRSGYKTELDTIKPNDIATFKKIAGDDIYAITDHHCFVSRDSGKSWQLDTLGIGKITMNDLDLDSNQRVYLGTNKGVYTQELTSNQWIKNSSYGNITAKAVFVDRWQRIWVAANNGMMVSTNFGSSFLAGPSGIGTDALNTRSICDDSAGNIYIATGNKLFKSTGGTQPFTRIDAGIISQINEAIAGNTFNSISAGRLLVAGTAYGIFVSQDGITWKDNNDGIISALNYGLVKTSSNRLVMSTDLGVFTRNAGSTSWNKTLPATGFTKGAKIFNTNSGNLYTTSQNNKLIWKSTDNGSTWSLDTVGFSNIKAYSFYVDEQENMHAFVLASPNSIVYVRNKGGNWATDMDGFKSSNFTTSTAWGADKSGNLYLATAGIYLQKRPITGTAWTTDTVGLNTQALVYDLAVQPDGTLWAGTYIGVFKKVGGKWSQLNYPTGTNPCCTNSCFAVSVDGSGAVWTSWSIFNTLGHSIGTGIYFTSDGGNKWTGMGIDTVTVRQLVSVGDTTYAVSYADGSYQFTRDTKPGNIKSASNGKTGQINIYPNPANEMLHITCIAKSVSKVQIIDVTGKLIWCKEEVNTNEPIDVWDLTPGIYNLIIYNASQITTIKFIKE